MFSSCKCGENFNQWVCKNKKWTGNSSIHVVGSDFIKADDRAIKQHLRLGHLNQLSSISLLLLKIQTRLTIWENPPNKGG